HSLSIFFYYLHHHYLHPFPTRRSSDLVLMKHVVGLVRADAGRVLFDGEDITEYSEAEFYEVRRRCSFVFQHSTLFDSLTILDNVDRKSTRLNSSHVKISYAVFCLKKKK